jgi:outer membrane protein assembly factor BamB
MAGAAGEHMKRIMGAVVLGALAVVFGLPRAAPHAALHGEPLPARTWSTYLDGLGTFSSPRAADFNGDGVLDVVVGAGREEFIPTDSAVVALDGATGAVLWHIGARDQVFGSAAVGDLNGDGTPDVVIGGRSAELLAVDGGAGTLLWSYFPSGDSAEARRNGLFNFYNPQFIPDQDGDGVADLLVANGGDVLVEPYDTLRPPGHLMVVGGRDGRLIARAAMPDGRETYLSAVVADLRCDGRLDVIFGSGGETVGGHLYRAPLAAVLDGDLSAAVELAASDGKGFIGPPALADITGDGVLDIVANAVDGRMLAFDGADHAGLWQVELPGTEAYTSLAVGYFTEDDVPDFFTSYAVGRWPDLGWSRQFMVDGRTGRIAFTDSLGLYQTASPVVLDYNGDGRDDVLLSVNFEARNALQQKRFYTMLVAVDFGIGGALQLRLLRWSRT